MARRAPTDSPSRTALNCARISALPVVASIDIPFRSPLVGTVLAPPSQLQPTTAPDKGRPRSPPTEAAKQSGPRSPEARVISVVEMMGFEPTTPTLRT